MSLHPNFARLRTVINGCAGYRVLENHELIEETDETVCASTLIDASYGEWWHTILAKDYDHWRGLTVEQANEPGREMDARERLFRRKSVCSECDGVGFVSDGFRLDDPCPRGCQPPKGGRS